MKVHNGHVRPERVRYIKLGRHGGWEQECIEKGIIRYGFDTAREDRFALCTDRKWSALTESFLKEGKGKGTATRFTNEAKLFFEDTGSTLWVTFVGEVFYWGFLSKSPAVRHKDGKGVWRGVREGWRSTDLNGGHLTKDRLSGALTKLAAYRGTSCEVDVADYVIRRVNGIQTPEVEEALIALKQLKAATLAMMRLLGPRDFETLVDLVFTGSGWRRVGVVGKTQKTLDLDITLPSTGERAIVQVKSKTTSAELTQYVSQLDDLGPYDRMFFVFHSGEATTSDERVTVIPPDRLSDLVLDAGLTTWILRKVS